MERDSELRAQGSESESSSLEAGAGEKVGREQPRPMDARLSGVEVRLDRVEAGLTSFREDLVRVIDERFPIVT